MTTVSNVDLIQSSTNERKAALQNAIRQINYKIAILDAAIAKLQYIDMKGSANLQ